MREETESDNGVDADGYTDNRGVGYIAEREVSVNLREVIITPLNSGYLVKVGCQSIAVETTKTLLKALGEYLENPNGFEENWYKNTNRSKL
jgi:hypothetical protein